ncbi:hypothetical protein SAMN05216228_103063 [Rhizobium tibeticum]|uniref:Uncharacterized protein n=1 Tax=Rhizobium tibeticum TaxID=501024 RepID=A0A1H8TUF4_9HYPH|nr:hypothetical protein RTCCBAU85039_5309 [Rhizobium tibeticum]SEO94619.1 hypothetical protein SAMN05216228_103063 [Rhizobium tibeticum]
MTMRSFQSGRALKRFWQLRPGNVNEDDIGLHGLFDGRCYHERLKLRGKSRIPNKRVVACIIFKHPLKVWMIFMRYLYVWAPITLEPLSRLGI